MKGAVSDAWQTSRRPVTQVITAAALLAGIALKMSWMKLSGIVALSALVMSAELFNTGIEFILDHHVGQDFHPSIKLIKDIAASAVFVVCLGAAAVGSALFLPYIHLALTQGFSR